MAKPPKHTQLLAICLTLYSLGFFLGILLISKPLLISQVTSTQSEFPSLKIDQLELASQQLSKRQVPFEFNSTQIEAFEFGKAEPFR